MSQKSIQAFSAGVLLLVYFLLSGCSGPRSQLELVLQRGEIRIATYSGPATYYTDKDGETGLEFELATRFANHLGIELSLMIAKNSAEANELVQRGWADIAAGGLGRAKSRGASLIYGPGYQWLTRQIVYRINHKRPTSLEDIHPHQLDIADGIVPVSTLEKLRQKSPSLSWLIHKDKNNNELLELLEKDEIRYTLAFSNDIILARASNPEIRPAFTVTDLQPLAWAIKNSDDHSLLEAIQTFHKESAENGTLADLIERFYGPTGFFDYVDSRRFIKKFRGRLPDLKAYFKHSADRYDFDWRLLAALSYQESHWNKNARSHTGVRGLMMLTQPTARQLGVNNRLDPEQSIEGGTKYLSSLLQRLPERIREPDRTWFALAAYNVGFGHLEDARVLTDKDGGDPDNWQEVKLRLPLLSKRPWYKQTRYGYARGREPVKFVQKIIKYYNVLVQLTRENREQAPVLVDSIMIDSPVL